MSKTTGVIIGCTVVLGLGILAVALGVGGLMYLGRTPEAVSVSVEAPSEAAVGEVVDLKVNIKNVSRKSVTIGDVDLQESFLNGFTVVSADPTPKSSTRVPLVNSRSHTFDLAIPPGETRTVRFRLKAVAEGVHRGDLDVYVGLSPKTTVVEMVVRERGAAGPTSTETEPSKAATPATDL